MENELKQSEEHDFDQHFCKKLAGAFRWVALSTSCFVSCWMINNNILYKFVINIFFYIFAVTLKVVQENQSWNGLRFIVQCTYSRIWYSWLNVLIELSPTISLEFRSKLGSRIGRKAVSQSIIQQRLRGNCLMWQKNVL